MTKSRKVGGYVKAYRAYVKAHTVMLRTRAEVLARQATLTGGQLGEAEGLLRAESLPTLLTLKGVS